MFKKTGQSKFVKNDSLITILDSSKWRGNSMNEKGQFVNHEFPFQPNWLDVLRWQTERNKWAEEKKKDKNKLYQVENDLGYIRSENDVLVWLGHATFFIRINGVTFLTDPIFDSPNAFLKRHAKLPFDKNLLPKIDYLLISHDHRDHLDKKSLKFLFNRGDRPTILTGLEMDKWLKSNFKNDKYTCQTAGWYQQYQTNLKAINIFFLPARHWSKRGLFDTNKRLWGSFVIQSPEKTIYFSGDTGYGSHLKEVGSLFGNIDIALIGIGAYQPEWFMEPNHISPKNALKAIDEMGANQVIPMHYGTFDVSDEPLFEPIESLKKIHIKEYAHVNLNILKIGEVYELNKTTTLKN